MKFFNKNYTMKTVFLCIQQFFYNCRHIFCIHNPYKLSEVRKERYERAVSWMKEVSKGNIVIDGAPKLQSTEAEESNPWRIVSEPNRGTYL